MESAIERIIERHRRNLTDRAALDSQLEEIRQYIDPFLPNFTTIPIAGESLPPRLDDTAVDAADNYVRAIHQAMTPAGLAWLQFEPEDPALANDWGERERISRAETAIRNGLDRSNFQTEMQSFWRLYGNAGTAFLLAENRGEFYFSTFSSVGTSFFDNERGQVDTVGREVEMTARQIQQRGWDIFGTKIAESIHGNKPDDKHKVLHWIAPKEDFPTLNAAQRWVSIFISIEDKKALNLLPGGRYEGYEEFPVFCGRQIRVPADNLGRSRAFSIMARVKELNEIEWYWKSGIKASILGMYKNRKGNEWTKTGDPSVIDGGDILEFERPDDFQELRSPTNYGLAYQEITIRQEQIKEHFFWTQLNMRREKYNMTTMELMQAQGQVADLLVQQLANGYTDVIVPLSERLLSIAMRRGWVEWPVGRAA